MSREESRIVIAGPLAVVPTYGVIRLLGLEDGSAPMFLAAAFVYLAVLALVFWAEPYVPRLER